MCAGMSVELRLGREGLGALVTCVREDTLVLVSVSFQMLPQSKCLGAVFTLEAFVFAVCVQMLIEVTWNKKHNNRLLSFVTILFDNDRQQYGRYQSKVADYFHHFSIENILHYQY